MTNKWLVELVGQGDYVVLLVDEDAFLWITRKDTPGRLDNQSSWFDTSAPLSLNISPCSVTIGSYQNDRALHMLGSDAPQFDAPEDLAEYVRTHDIRIIDSWSGSIY